MTKDVIERQLCRRGGGRPARDRKIGGGGSIGTTALGAGEEIVKRPANCLLTNRLAAGRSWRRRLEQGKIGSGRTVRRSGTARAEVGDRREKVADRWPCFGYD